LVAGLGHTKKGGREAFFANFNLTRGGKARCSWEKTATLSC